MLASAYGWTPPVLAALTDAEIAYYHRWLPTVEARRHYGTAQLNADLREFAFPRYLEPEEPTEPPKPRDPWTTDELLPPFAWFEREDMTSEQAQALVDAFDNLPAWAKGCAPIDDAREILTD